MTETPNPIHAQLEKFKKTALELIAAAAQEVNILPEAKKPEEAGLCYVCGKPPVPGRRACESCGAKDRAMRRPARLDSPSETGRDRIGAEAQS